MSPAIRAFISVAVLAVLSMGALGGALFYLASPFLPEPYRYFEQLNGDWVWSAMITAGLLWSPSFLLSGALNHASRFMTLPRFIRILLRLLIFWVFAILAWHLSLLIWV